MAVGLVILQGANNVKNQVDATATVYMGQPVTPGGGALFANPPYANLSAVSKLITSLPSRTAAAAAANAVKGRTTVTPDSLSSRVTAHQLSAGGTSVATKTTSGPAYYSIEAQGPWSKAQVAIIADTLAKIVVTKASGYVDAKITSLTSEISTEQATIARASKNIANRQRVANTLAKTAGSNASNAAILAALLSGISADTSTINDNTAQLAQNQINLASAENIEKAAVANPAAGKNVTAQHKRSTLIVAAVAGLIIGTLLALAWDAALRRRQKGESPA